MRHNLSVQEMIDGVPVREWRNARERRLESAECWTC